MQTTEYLNQVLRSYRDVKFLWMGKRNTLSKRAALCSLDMVIDRLETKLSHLKDPEYQGSRDLEIMVEVYQPILEYWTKKLK